MSIPACEASILSPPSSQTHTRLILHAPHTTIPSHFSSIFLYISRLIGHATTRTDVTKLYSSCFLFCVFLLGRRVSVCGDCYAEQKREEEEEWEPQLEAALKKAANMNGKGIMDVKRAVRILP